MGDDDVEKVAKQKPDLIIVLDQNKNIKKYKKSQLQYHLITKNINI